MSSPSRQIPPAVLVSIILPKETEAQVSESLSELERLVNTLGYRVVGRLTQARSSLKTAAVLGEGKLAELAEYTGGSGEISATFQKKKSKAAEKFEAAKKDLEEEEAEFQEDDEDDEGPSKGGRRAPPAELAKVVIFDCDLSPSQLRNIESAVGVPVLDRTGVIIEIFSRHAKTRAAKLQIEIARLNYTAPRVRETGGGEDRGGGGIGGKGAGESKLELDRRRIRDRIKELKSELDSVQSEHLQRRTRRSEENSVALVGYTNAGKSSLMRALTGSEVLVADQLFATLDTTVRPLMPETKPKILISDTVGFIKKLPHDLVASFKSTLDEALNASILLYVVDAADPSFRSQLKVNREVLGEVGADDVPSLLILNKVDKISPEEIKVLKAEFPEGIFLSTRNRENVLALRERLLNFFEKGMVDEDLFIKHGTQGIIGDIRANMRVLKENYENEGVHITVRANKEEIARLKKKFSL